MEIYVDNSNNQSFIDCWRRLLFKAKLIIWTLEWIENYSNKFELKSFYMPTQLPKSMPSFIPLDNQL
jgi:hypothetical protein